MRHLRCSGDEPQEEVQRHRRTHRSSREAADVIWSRVDNVNAAEKKVGRLGWKGDDIGGAREQRTSEEEGRDTSLGYVEPGAWLSPLTCSMK